MISEKEFDVLQSLLSSPNIDEDEYGIELSSLRSDGLIDFNVTRSTRDSLIYEGFLVTPKGHRAYEEYLAFVKSQSLDTETLKAAKESNEISKQANTLSEKANDIAKSSKNLSKFAICVSIVAALIAIIDVIVGICT